MIGIFYGTRPEYIKLLPVISALVDLGIDYKLIQIRQHTDLIRHCEFDYTVKVQEGTVGRLNSIFHTALSMNLIGYKWAVVQGDTSTAAAVALSAFNQGVPVMHIEAGLRTYNKSNPFPEETNRRIISAIASVHYCPTGRDMRNLVKEGLSNDDIVWTGNTVIDNLQGRETTKGNTVIITMHRRENQPHLKDWFSQIDAIASEHPEYEFIFPMHPSPQVQKHREVFKYVQVIDPVDHETMLDMIASCKCVITDSGGMQEECSFFRKRCFVCREVTERPCPGQELCETPKALHSAFNKNFNIDFDEPTPFGDGYAGEKIAKDIQKRI